MNAVSEELNLTLSSLSETKAFGRKLGGELGPFANARDGETLVLFFGPMAAGKTTLIKAVCEALGISSEAVISPTYTLVNIYPGKTTVYHVDLYRIENPEALWEMDRSDWINPQGMTLVEWPERGEPILEGEDALEIHMVPLENPDDETRQSEARQVRIVARGQSFASLRTSLAQS